MFAVVLTSVHVCVSIFTFDFFVVIEAQEVFQFRKVLLMACYKIVYVVDGVPAELWVLSKETLISLLRLPIAR